jgi:TonB family protein
MKILFFLFLLFGLNPIYGQEIKPKCLEGNCKNKIGTFQYADGSVYIGSFTEKLRNGQGKITYKSEATYEGEWVNDKRHGQGVFIDSLKNRYEGAWLDDKENGAGKYTDAKGNVYEGSWTNGALIGYITLRFKNKSFYEGEYNNGIRGKGKFTYADGSLYTGNFAKNKRSGYGEFIYPFGLTYKGNWVSNEIEGQGDFFETNSQKILASGSWKTEKSDAGHLIYISDNGFMVCYYKNKDMYYGQASKGLPNGNGVMVYSNGEIYEGTFKAGQYNGYGRYLYKDKSEYKGDWKNGLREGFGTLMKNDKTEEKGYFEKGKYLGKEKPLPDGLVLINGYKGIEIGEQIWLAQNLSVDRFRNGDPVPHAKTNEEWKRAGEMGEPAWCYYNNDSSNAAKYGKLYNWYAVNDPRILAPEGWHISSEEDWTQLADYYGGKEIAGGKIKLSSAWCTEGNYDFDIQNLDLVNFNAVSGGERLSNGTFIGKYTAGNWFCSSTLNFIWMQSWNNSIGISPLLTKILVSDTKQLIKKRSGFSVRCLSDENLSNEKISTQEQSDFESTQNNEIVSNIVEPEFPGGISAQLQFIQKNFKYPNIDLSNNVSGKVEVTFNVEADGRLTNIRITKGLTETTNAEAVKVIKAMPNWIPGTIDGLKTRQEFTLPINFSLE